MTFQVRRAGAADREVLTRLLMAQLAEHDLPADEARVIRGLDVALAPDSPAWLFVAQGTAASAASAAGVLGVMLVQRCASVEKGGLGLWIEELYVVPAARRQGVARALLQHVIDAAPALGIVSLDLEVVKSQSAALALYPAIGFKRVDRLRFTREL